MTYTNRVRVGGIGVTVNGDPVYVRYVPSGDLPVFVNISLFSATDKHYVTTATDEHYVTTAPEQVRVATAARKHGVFIPTTRMTTRDYLPRLHHTARKEATNV